MLYRTVDVLIIGGGLAGLVNGIHLAKSGLKVVLVEKKSYPFHRVCGEYISKEILPYLRSLDADPASLGYKEMSRFQLTAPSGKMIEAELPLGAISVSRYGFDHFLYQKALSQGVTFHLNTAVNDVDFNNDLFRVKLSEGDSYQSKVVIGAYGKRSNLDRVLQRPFFRQRSPYLGVKYHRIMDFPEDLVALHNFQSGYCGVSMVENGQLNVCYLTTRDLLRKYKTIPKLESSVLYQNPHIKRLFEESRSSFDQPLVINEISFAPKNQVEHHILMSGDSAGMISPLCGNGMAMAIQSANLLSNLVIDYFHQKSDRHTLEESYTLSWHKQFARRLFMGRLIQESFQHRWISEQSIGLLSTFPGLIRPIIKQTHGTVPTKDPVCHYTA